MGSQRRREHGSEPLFDSGDWRDDRNLKEMNISELVSLLRDTFFKDDFDQVEEALVAREVRLKAEVAEKVREIGSLQQKLELERTNNVKVEEELKKYREMCEEGKTQMESWNRKFCELEERVLKLENDTHTYLLKNGEAPGGGNTEGESLADPGFPIGVEEEKEDHGREFESNIAGSAPPQRNEDTHLSFGASGRGCVFHEMLKQPPITNVQSVGARLEPETIEINDSDEDECIPQKSLHGKKGTSQIIADNNGHPSSSSSVQQKKQQTGVAEAIGIHRRGLASSSELVTNINNILDGLDSDSDTSSSSADSFDLARLPLSINVNNKKRKTEEASGSGLNS